MNFGLQGKRALVTAASSGLGLACAQALIDEGASVFICARNEARLAAAARSIAAAGYFGADITAPDNAEALVKAAVEKLGGLDILVTNVGHPLRRGFDELQGSDWENAGQAVLLSVARLIRLASPWLKLSDSPRVVNITALTANEVMPGRILSGSYRAAMNALAKYAADDIAAFGGTINNIAPGRFLTRGESSPSRDWDEKAIAESARDVPLRRLGNPRELGALCAFLCSSQAGYVTGQTIAIDGGVSRVIR